MNTSPPQPKLGMQTPVSNRGDSHKKARNLHLVRENASFSEVVGILQNALVAEEGLEAISLTHLPEAELRQLVDSHVAQNDAFLLQDDRLQAVIDAWPALSEATRRRVLALVRKARAQD